MTSILLVEYDAFIPPIPHTRSPVTPIDGNRAADAQNALTTNRQAYVIRHKVNSLPPVLPIGGEVGGIVVIAADGIGGEIAL